MMIDCTELRIKLTILNYKRHYVTLHLISTNSAIPNQFAELKSFYFAEISIEISNISLKVEMKW